MAFELVVMGTSLGGFNALPVILSGLPKDFPLAVAIVQHRSVETTDDSLRDYLQRHSLLPVHEVDDKQSIEPGRVYLCPPDYHLLVEKGRFSLSVEGPVLAARPSIDVLFESAAESYGSKTIAILLTGASEDGARGLARINERGGVVVVQAPETAHCGVMPRAAIAATGTDRILQLEEIAKFLVSVTLQPK
jgi:two-component system chemotaxis response regulator CheB